MQTKPRLTSNSFFMLKELSTSIVQGLVITTGTLSMYQLSIHMKDSEAITRTLIFLNLISANIFLTIVNRSFKYSILTTIFYKNNLLWMIISLTILLTSLMIYNKSIATFFEFEKPEPKQVVFSVGLGISSVIWYEILKFFKRKKK